MNGANKASASVSATATPQLFKSADLNLLQIHVSFGA
jgi:hypothetical protein